MSILKSVYLIFMLILCALMGWDNATWAGNKVIVEDRVEQLNTLNLHAIEAVPDIPANGAIDLKADVREENGTYQFEFHKKESTVKEGSIGIPDGEETEKPGAQTNMKTNK